MTVLGNSKELLRKKALEARNFIEYEDIARKSSAIIKTLISLKEFIESRFIMCYVDFRKEVVTRGLIKECISKGKRIAVPLIEPGTGARKSIAACEIIDIEAELAKGCYGILEPVKDSARRVPPEDLDMVIVPGVAFDLKKNRIGYGGGYYDRFLRKTRFNCVKVGLAFEAQIVAEIPACENDVPMDIIITEERIIK